MTPDEVRTLDNKNVIVFIRGERPVIDLKYDLMKHPNISLTHSGGAFPYVHSPVFMFGADDLNFTFSNMEELEIIDMEDLIETTSQEQPEAKVPQGKPSH